MPENISSATTLTIVISTLLLLVLGTLLIAFLVAYQRKGERHLLEVARLKEQYEKALLLSKVEMQEQTLDRIAKELHANIAQIVSVINIHMGVYLHRFSDDPDPNIVEAKKQVKQLMTEVKNLSIASNTDHVKQVGFQTILRNEVERLERTGCYTIQWDVEGAVYRISSEKELILIRMCQEVLNNIVRHAEADCIRILLSYTRTGLRVVIRDNGTGFDVQKVERTAADNGSTGLNNMSGRARLIEGTLQIRSVPNQGTDVEINIPI